MSAVMKISPQGQIRIPKKIMQALSIDSGDYVEVDIQEGNIILKPRKLIDPSQGWYWTKEWQQMEAEVDEEIKKDELSPYQFSKKFKKGYRTLPEEIQKNFGKKLPVFLNNMLHPSLRVKRIQGTKNIWEASVTIKYRFTFELADDKVIFRSIGTHDILDRE
jgi:AbrB family looped-hinge helix DNA binding protein